MRTPNRRSWARLPILLVLLTIAGVTCGKNDNGIKGDNGNNGGTPGRGTSEGTGYPMVTPPVKQATPGAFKAGGTRALPRRLMTIPNVDLDANAFISRFFSAGPTNLFNILGGVDSIITNINMQSAQNAQPCLKQTPVPYDLAVPGGHVQMYAQCYEDAGAQYEGDPAFVQWGQHGGNFYIYSAVGVGWTAVVVTPATDANVSADANADVGLDANATTDANTTLDGNATAAASAADTLDLNNYIVHAWYSVGLNNFTVTYSGINGLGWFNGSYCVAEIYADPSANRFEMTAAGGGVGFCGAQFVSDGNDVFGIGSTDMGSTCNATATVCIDANTGAPQQSCALDANSFVLTPLGRQASVLSPNATWAASDYPGDGNNLVVLDGNSTDSAHFGPVAPDAGAGLFEAMQAGGNTTVGNANVSVNANATVNAHP